MTLDHSNQPVIVAGHDGSASGADAVAFGALYARAVGGRLIVAGWYRQEFPLFPGSDDLEIEMRRVALEPLELIDTEALGVPVDLRAVAGRSPAEALHRVAERSHAELVVVGSTHRGRLGRVHPGSTGERLLQEAPCAVATAPRGFAAAGEHDVRVIAVAFESTVEGRRAVALAADMASAAGAALRVFSVVEPGATIYGPVLSGAMYAELESDRRERAQQELDELLAELPPSAGGTVLEGAVVPELLGAFDDGVDVAVMGSRAYGPIGRTLAGSVSGAVVRQAPCPVVIVPRAVAEAEQREHAAVGAAGAPQA